MAKNNNPRDGHLNGAIRERTQFQHPNGHWMKRDTATGQITNVKQDTSPFKSVRKEK
jgi:hypothetical protein